LIEAAARPKKIKNKLKMIIPDILDLDSF